jgi:hypothetical protein
MGLILTTEYINWIDIQKNAYFASAVPIPGAMWLMGSTLLGLIAFAKRREKC